MRVLLVEDHPDTQEQMCQWFSLMAGAEVVHVARTSAQAVDWMRDHPAGWDLAVIDLFLADGHGFQVLRHCHARGHQRAVVLTNYTREPVREHARRAGADAVFDKSLEMGQLARYCRDRQVALAG